MIAKKPSAQNLNKKWWKEAVVYQIYPRSFKDSDGDGVGDLKGIIQKLDYIKSLGIDVVWLNPIYASPNDDNGYDISDYRDIMKEFGTMNEFDEMLKGMHKRKIKLVMDLVVNHSSDEHKWFEESRSARDNAYRDFYHWWPAEKGKPTKRWSFFDENENAWHFDQNTNSYYLHYFSRKQPDLNWENKKVREEVYSLMKFWFDKGVDGFRMDVIPFISKDTTFPPLPAAYKGDFVKYYARGPRVHEYLKEMNKEVLSKYDIMTVGEGAGVQIEDALKFVDEDRKELNTFFHFEGMNLGKHSADWNHPERFKLVDFKKVYTKWDSVFKTKGWGTVYLGNHDQSRMVSRFGNDKPEFREASSKMLYTFLLTQRATPYVYYGDEIGMTNIRFKNIKDYNDLSTKNNYDRLVREGKSTDQFMKMEAELSRDNGRTPMQWNASKNAGFTTGKPWLKINNNFSNINVEAAEKNKNSILNYFKTMIKLRKDLPELVYGKYKVIDEENANIYAYTRTLDNKKVLVVLNFSNDKITFYLPKTLGIAKGVLINNLNRLTMKERELKLLPYQSIILRLQ